MAGIWGTYSSGRIISSTVTIPMYGAWAADIVLALFSTIQSTGQIVLGDLSLAGFVQRTSSFAGSRSARLVAGFGGWQKAVPVYGYSNPSGVLLSSVLKDVAGLVGEKVAVAADGSIGSFFAREAGPASRVLRQLAGSLWWVDPAGTTQIGPRTNTSPITSAFEVISWNGGNGQFEIASENLKDWMPSRTFTSPLVSTPQTVSTVTIRSTNEGTLRLDVLVTP